METWQFPLVLFTVISQWAIGIALMLTLIDYFYPAAFNDATSKSLRTGGMFVFPMIGLGLICSIFHLGQPFVAYRAILNLGQSNLSMEIFSFLIVGVLALIYSYLWWKTPEKSFRKILGAILSIVGLVAIYFSSQVYALPARVAWNSWLTTVAFLLTSVLLGAVSVGYLIRTVENESVKKAKKTLGIKIITALVLIIVVLASFAKTYGITEEQSIAVVSTFGSVAFLLRLILGILLPATLASLFIVNHKSSNKLVVIALIGTFIGEVVGRISFYSSVMGQYPWF